MSFSKKTYICLPLFSCIFAVAMIEICLVIFYPIPSLVPNNMYYEPDIFTGYKLRPNSIGYFQEGIVAKTNSHGHRNSEVNFIKQPGVFRILVLGDSFTVGANVKQEESYPQVLEKLCIQTSNEKIQVINAGVSGFGPYQYAEYYEHYGYRFEPDIIIVGFFVGNDTYECINDVSQTDTAIDGRIITRYSEKSKLILLKLFLYDNLNIARIILNKECITKNRSCYRIERNDFTEKFLSTQRQRLSNHLKINNDRRIMINNTMNQILRIKNIADNNSSKLIVMLIPDENQVNNDLQGAIIDKSNSLEYDFNMPQLTILEILNENNVFQVNLLPYFLQENRCLYMNDTHFNPQGHELAAKIMFNYLLANNFLNP